MRLRIDYSGPTEKIRTDDKDCRVNILLADVDHSRIRAVSKFMEDNNMPTAMVLLEALEVKGLHIDSSLSVTRNQCRMVCEDVKYAAFEILLSDDSVVTTEIIPLDLLTKVETENLEIYTDGSCLGNPGTGGAAAIVVNNNQIITGTAKSYKLTTNNRMELRSVIEGIRLIDHGKSAVVYSDSQYVVNTINKGWKRNKNKDLWALLDRELNLRSIKLEWIKGHNGNKFNNIVDDMAKDASAKTGTGVLEDEGYGG